MFNQMEHQIRQDEMYICLPNLQSTNQPTNLETDCVIGKEDSIDGATDGPENPNDGDGIQ